MIDETKINLDLGNKKFGSGKTGSGKKIFATKKVNKSYVVVFGTIAIFILMIIYIFNLESEDEINNKIASQNQVENQFDMSKIEAENQKSLNSSEPQKIDEVKEAREYATNIDDDNLVVAENINLKNQIEFLKQEIRDLKTQITNKNAKNNYTQKDKSEDDTNKATDDMKDYLTSIKSNIKINTDSFHFEGKNFYIGDKIKTYQIRDIKKNSIRFCDQWCYTLIF